MSEVQSGPALVATPKPNAIQLIEAELANFIKQAEVAAKNAEQAVANVHAIQGAIQGTKHLLAKLQGAAASAQAEIEKVIGEVKPEVEHSANEAVANVSKGIAIVENDVKKL